MGDLELWQGHCDASSRYQIETPHFIFASTAFRRCRTDSGLWCRLECGFDPDADQPRGDRHSSRAGDLPRSLRPPGPPTARRRGSRSTMHTPIGGWDHGDPVFRSSQKKAVRTTGRAQTTDTDSRFTLSGLGRAVWARLTIDGPRFAIQTIFVETEGAVGPRAIWPQHHRANQGRRHPRLQIR